MSSKAGGCFPCWNALYTDGSGGKELTALLARARAFEHTTQTVLQQASPPKVEAKGPLRIFGFGRGRVECGGRGIPLSEWEAASVRHLLFHLLTHPLRSRDQNRRRPLARVVP